MSSIEKCIFRHAHKGEGPVLTALSLRSKSYWGYAPEYVEKFRAVLTIDDAYIENWPVIVLDNVSKTQNEIIGFYSLKTVNGENRLDNLWLDVPFIRKGFGHVALKNAMQCAVKLGWDHFYLVSEPKAVLFYEKFGAVHVGIIPSRSDANLMLPHLKILF